MPVTTMARNTMAGPTVLSSDPKGTHFVEWQGANDPNGEDIQPVPEEVVNCVAFMKAVARGVLVIENPDDNPELAQAMERQNTAWKARQEGADRRAVESIDQQANNDIIALKCIGPDTRGQGLCGADVSVRDKAKDDKPTLCPLHADLAPQYIPENIMESGKNVKKWTRATMGARQHADS
jgi:hypothetical protein